MEGFCTGPENILRETCPSATGLQAGTPMYEILSIPAMDSPLAMKNRQKNLPVLRLLIMECIDRVQSRRFLGRVKAKDQANENGEKERTYNGGH